jgi:hypothetical protein
VGPVLHAVLDSVSFHSGKWQQDGAPSRPLDECADRGTVQPDDEVALPVSGHLAIVDLGGAAIEGDLGGDEAALVAPCAAGPCPGYPQRTPGP